VKRTRHPDGLGPSLGSCQGVIRALFAGSLAQPTQEATIRTCHNSNPSFGSSSPVLIGSVALFCSSFESCIVICRERSTSLFSRFMPGSYWGLFCAFARNSSQGRLDSQKPGDYSDPPLSGINATCLMRHGKNTSHLQNRQGRGKRLENTGGLSRQRTARSYGTNQQGRCRRMGKRQSQDRVASLSGLR
jgi:hypothetical protein